MKGGEDETTTTVVLQGGDSDDEGDGSDTGSESVVSSRNPSFAVQSREHSISVVNTTANSTTTINLNNNVDSNVNEIDINKLDINAGTKAGEEINHFMNNRTTTNTTTILNQKHLSMISRKDSASIVTIELASKRSTT